jgi:hypothetical protein
MTLSGKGTIVSFMDKGKEAIERLTIHLKQITVSSVKSFKKEIKGIYSLPILPLPSRTWQPFCTVPKDVTILQEEEQDTNQDENFA